MLGKFEEMKLLALCMATDNPDALSRLSVAYQVGLRRLIHNQTGGDASLTDDLAQETFLKAWLGIRSFKGLSGFKTWLYRIAVNEFISHRRKKGIDSSTTCDIADINVTEHSNCHAATEARLDVNEILRHLSDAERIVTLLFYLEDQPIKKICQITSMPEGTVKSHLKRARDNMARFINNN